ncbi:hypothetical protein KSC_066630 [Ktedonobacter sp. SOSP1-52]|nr:hypothetical protein KSC_066630 [Ktedonobacter sp. SOSP1-52]
MTPPIELLFTRGKAKAYGYIPAMPYYCDKSGAYEIWGGTYEIGGLLSKFDNIRQALTSCILHIHALLYETESFTER